MKQNLLSIFMFPQGMNLFDFNHLMASLVLSSGQTYFYCLLTVKSLVFIQAKAFSACKAHLEMCQVTC